MKNTFRIQKILLEPTRIEWGICVLLLCSALIVSCDSNNPTPTSNSTLLNKSSISTLEGKLDTAFLIHTDGLVNAYDDMLANDPAPGAGDTVHVDNVDDFLQLSHPNQYDSVVDYQTLLDGLGLETADTVSILYAVIDTSAYSLGVKDVLYGVADACNDRIEGNISEAKFVNRCDSLRDVALALPTDQEVYDAGYAVMVAKSSAIYWAAESNEWDSLGSPPYQNYPVAGEMNDDQKDIIMADIIAALLGGGPLGALVSSYVTGIGKMIFDI